VTPASTDQADVHSHPDDSRLVELFRRADDEQQCMIMLMCYAMLRKDKVLCAGLEALGHMRRQPTDSEISVEPDFTGLPKIAAVVPDAERVWWARLTWRILETNDHARWVHLRGLICRRAAS